VIGVETIAVVGGGPAGSIAAYCLGKAGVKVDLYEPKGPWEKPCAGAVTPKVRDRIPEMTRLNRSFLKVAVGRFVSPSGTMIDLTSRRPLWVLSRKDLNGFLLDLAVSQPSVKLRSEKVLHIERRGSLFSVIADRDRVYDVLLGCDGVSSKVRRTLVGRFPNEHIAFCKGYYLKTEGENTAITRFAPFHGYFWSFPRTDSICVGAGSRDKKAPIERWLETVLQEQFPGRERLGSYAALMPAVSDPAFFDLPVCGRNWALCGDAAGYVDSLTGEGICYALESGKAAAAALMDGKLHLYRQRVADTFGRHLRACARASKAFYHSPILDGMIGLASKSGSLRDFLITFMSDQPEASEAASMLMKKAPGILKEILWR